MDLIYECAKSSLMPRQAPHPQRKECLVTIVRIPGRVLSKVLLGGVVLQCNEYNYRSTHCCRGSGGVSPRKYFDFEVSLSHF